LQNFSPKSATLNLCNLVIDLNLYIIGPYGFNPHYTESHQQSKSMNFKASNLEAHNDPNMYKSVDLKQDGIDLKMGMCLIIQNLQIS
jgi:hypothetical protein